MERLPRYLLSPADIFVASKPHVISTVLGSCVSVCLYSPARCMGAINHYVLPQWNGSDLATMKYGNMSIVRIIEEILNLGCPYEDLRAMVLGGAEVLANDLNRFHIGSRNIEIAYEILKEFRIPIVASETGGFTGRKIIFNTLLGEVQCFLINQRNVSLPKTLMKFT